MKRWIVAAAVLGILSGCQNNHDEAKQASMKRWYSARAEVLCGLGREQLKVGQLEGAGKSCREALALEADCVNARILLGTVYIEQGQYIQAKRELGSAAALDPSSAEVCYLLGVAQEKNGELPEALASYRKTLVLDDQYVDAILAVGEVMAEMDQPAEALAYVEQNMKLIGNRPAAYELAGRLAMILKDHDKAQQYCQLACDLDYANPCYLEALAQAQLLGGRMELAEGTLRKLVATDRYGERAWVRVMLGDCLLARGMAAEARDEYIRAGELAPDDAAAWVGLAKACMAMSDMHRATLAANEALKADGTSSEASMVLGYALLRSGQVSRAVEVLRRGASASPEDAVLQCLLGRAYAVAGQPTQAKDCYAAALKLEPNNQLARTLLASAAQGAATPK